ncbi:hypothetical protein RvY_10507 [Ramazzottius varieornatus]|uniref:Uncharacterized protein n=1 Tax=Ramazzottius varieornatus TaxID=947166 RepID=A0A1D1VFE5_RAMVA|nr:hypothetical protein RvY_10507 [Ramazzottius varieornatus]
MGDSSGDVQLKLVSSQKLNKKEPDVAVAGRGATTSMVSRSIKPKTRTAINPDQRHPVKEQRCGKCSGYSKKGGISIHERTCNPAEVMRRKTNAMRQTETTAPTPPPPVMPGLPPSQPTAESITAALREKWTVKFQDFCKELSVEEFTQFKDMLQAFIQDINEKTPKPPRRSIKHPNVSCHQQRKTAGFQSRKATHGSSNPQRKDDRSAEASRKNHQWKRAQYMFENKRKKLVGKIVETKDNRRCPKKKWRNIPPAS